MPAFKLRAFAALYLLAGVGLAPAALAQDGQARHAATNAGGKAELGTGAAVDARGRIWIAGKESAADGQYVVLHMSADGGHSWSAPRRIQRAPEAVSADGENRPKLAFGPDGALYITYTKPLAKQYTGEIRLVRSPDGGQTFLPPATVHANRDQIAHRFDANQAPNMETNAAAKTDAQLQAEAEADVAAGDINQIRKDAS